MGGVPTGEVDTKEHRSLLIALVAVPLAVATAPAAVPSTVPAAPSAADTAVPAALLAMETASLSTLSAVERAVPAAPKTTGPGTSGMTAK